LANRLKCRFSGRITGDRRCGCWPTPSGANSKRRSLCGARPRKEDRRTIEAIIWRLDNGAKWLSIPAELGNWHHAYLRFRRWAVGGVWDRIMAHVVADGEPKLAFACIDGTVARAHQKAGARASKSTA
jgi:transposase